MNNKMLFLILAIAFLLILTLIEEKLSILFWGIIWLSIGNGVISVTLKKNHVKAKTIYFLFFLIYFIYSTLTNYFYVSSSLTDYFYAPDSLHFYSYSNILGELHSLKQVIYTSFTDFTSSDWKAFALISGVVSFSSNLIDTNNIIVQKLIIVFFSAIILPYIFNILCNYFDDKKSFTLTLIYGLFSYSLFYSAVFIRDVPIGLFFIILIYLFYTKHTFSKIPIFLLVSLLIFLFRPEHGIFSLIFLVGYLYLFLKENDSKYKYILVFTFVFIAIISASTEIAEFLNTINSTSDRYLENSVNVANSSSLGGLLLKLPWGIRHVSAGLFSQIMPFPFYLGLEENGLGFIPLSIGALFWFFIWVVIIRFLFTSNKRNLIDNKLWILFFIALTLVLGASVNADTRRIMAVNPIFFIISMKIYFSTDKLNRIKSTFYTFFIYLLLLVVYLIVKG